MPPRTDENTGGTTVHVELYSGVEAGISCLHHCASLARHWYSEAEGNIDFKR